MRYLVTVSYKGTNYQGWQRQSKEISIEETIDTIISQILNAETKIVASGRTDAGVHAKGQTFHFDCDKKICISKFRYSLNRLLPKDIHIVSIHKVSNDFHARYNAKGKKYVYLINTGETDPFISDFVYDYHQKIKLDLLKTALKKFEGKMNFKDFTSKEIDDKNFVREIYKISVKTLSKSIISITFKGEGFMRYQIRYIVGTCLAYANGKITMDYIDYHLSDKESRNVVNLKAPASGLILDSVLY